MILLTENSSNLNYLVIFGYSYLGRARFRLEVICNPLGKVTAYFIIIKKMKKLQLANFGLEEMSDHEMNQTNGGVLGIDDLAVLAIGFVITVAFTMGMNDGAKNKSK